MTAIPLYLIPDTELCRFQKHIVQCHYHFGTHYHLLPTMPPKRRRIFDEPLGREVEFVEVSSKRLGTRVKSRRVGLVSSPRKPKRSRHLDASRQSLPPPKLSPPSAGSSQRGLDDMYDFPSVDDNPDWLANDPPKTKKPGKVCHRSENHQFVI
jgi:hypothetical protein